MNILFATDGSEFSETALEFMLRFPFPRDSKMTVLTVVADIPMLPAELEALDDTQNAELEEANRQLRDDAKELLLRVGNRLRDDGWPGETMLRNGNPIKEILQVAQETDADLVVLGSHGTGMAERFLLGSVSDRVLESAPCSVLIVRKCADTAEPAIEPGSNAAYRIMLAYDNSDVVQDALNLCASLPLEEHSEIRVVNVMPLITAYRQDVRQHINSIWLQKKQIMQAELEKAVKSLKWATPNVTTELREAENVSDEILVAAEQAGSDLIMVGCTDKGVVKRLLLGSISQRMARYSKCTVWAVRKKRNNT